MAVHYKRPWLKGQLLYMYLSIAIVLLDISTYQMFSKQQTEQQLKIFSTLNKQRICLNTQLKSSKKQLELNVCVPKSNSNDRYAITCDVIAYHLVHFVSIWVINKCQSGIDFIFTSERTI